jgi:hypothetical protein
MWRRLLAIAAIAVAAIAGWLVWLLNAAGEFRTLAPHFDGACTAVAIAGAEDLTISPRSGVAYVSAVRS